MCGVGAMTCLLGVEERWDQKAPGIGWPAMSGRTSGAEPAVSSCLQGPLWRGPQVHGEVHGPLAGCQDHQSEERQGPGETRPRPPAPLATSGLLHFLLGPLPWAPHCPRPLRAEQESCLPFLPLFHDSHTPVSRSPHILGSRVLLDLPGFLLGPPVSYL